MINRGLDIYPLPRALESFIKGPWYESAQLVVLKYGTDSEQWQQMSAVTDTLLESMRSREDVGENRRQQVFELIAKLPREVRRWLLSLQHDQAALDRHTAGEIDLAPPTWITLYHIARYAPSAAILEAFRGQEPKVYQTRVAKRSDGVRVAMWSGDAGYEPWDADVDGERHRLVMATDGFSFENSVEAY